MADYSTDFGKPIVFNDGAIICDMSDDPNDVANPTTVDNNIKAGVEPPMVQIARDADVFRP